MPSLVSVSDLINHFVAFVTLYLLFSMGYETFTCKRKAILLILYALSIEIIQYFLPARSAELLDVLVDALGIFVGWWLYKFTNKASFSL